MSDISLTDLSLKSIYKKPSDTERAKPKFAITRTMCQTESVLRIVFSLLRGQQKVGAEARCMLSTTSLAKQELAIKNEWRRL